MLKVINLRDWRKPVKEIIFISSRYEKRRGNAIREKGTRTTKEEKLTPIKQISFETEEIGVEKKSLPKEKPSISKNSEREKQSKRTQFLNTETEKEKETLPKQVLFLTREAETGKWTLPKPTRFKTTKPVKEIANSREQILSKTKETKDVTNPTYKDTLTTSTELLDIRINNNKKHYTDKEKEDSDKQNQSETSRVSTTPKQTQYRTTKAPKERKNSRQQNLSKTRETEKKLPNHSCKEIVTTSSEFQKKAEDFSPSNKGISSTTTEEKESKKHRKRNHRDKETDSADEYNLSAISAKRIKIERANSLSEILPSTTVVDKENLGLFQPICSGTSEGTNSEDVSLEEQSCEERTSEDRNSEEQTSEESSSEKEEFLYRTTEKETDKRSPLKQILNRATTPGDKMATPVESASNKGDTEIRSNLKEILSRGRNMLEEMEIASAEAEKELGSCNQNISHKGQVYPDSASTENSSINVERDLNILHSEFNPAITKQINNEVVMPKVHVQDNEMPENEYGQNEQRQQSRPVRTYVPTKMIHPSHEDIDLFECERNCKNVYIQKYRQHNQKFPSGHTPTRIRYITQYYRDVPIDHESMEVDDNTRKMRYHPYDYGEMPPRTYLRSARLVPELPSPSQSTIYHRNDMSKYMPSICEPSVNHQEQCHQAAAHPAQEMRSNSPRLASYPRSLPANYLTDWMAAGNPANQVQINNQPVQPTLEMPSSYNQSTCQRNLPLWMQPKSNEVQFNAPSMNRQPVQPVQAGVQGHSSVADMAKWMQPSANQGSFNFESMNSREYQRSVNRWANATFGNQVRNEPGNIWNVSSKPDKEMLPFGYPNMFRQEADNRWNPVSNNLNNVKSAFEYPNTTFRHEEGAHNRERYPVSPQADSTTGNSPSSGNTMYRQSNPLQNLRNMESQNSTYYTHRPPFYKPEAYRPSQSSYPGINNYTSMAHRSLSENIYKNVHQNPNNLPEYDPRRNR